jgi:MinD superfamily P-loop ATPase
MIHEVVIISGKGGTGKTSITAALAFLAQPVVLADCDVDAPDLHLLTQPTLLDRQPFSGGKKAIIHSANCWGCGLCAMTCRFDAIHRENSGKGVTGITYAVDAMACEGCKACVVKCPAQVITFESIHNGEQMVSTTSLGPMAHARMNPGEENSGKLVSSVRNQARQIAQQHKLKLILVDGSPGIGCPVIASLTGASAALVITEPTPSGEHDALRVMQLAKQMRVPLALCVNRWDINPQLTNQLENQASQLGAFITGRIRQDKAMVDAQMLGLSIMQYKPTEVARDICHVYEQLKHLGWLGASSSTCHPQGVVYEDRSAR